MDGWLCGDCRSLNTPRAKSCYRCNVPRHFGEAPEDLTSAAIVRGTAPGTTSAPAATTSAPAKVAGEPRPGVLPPGAKKAAEARGRPTLSDARSSRGRSRLLVLLLAASTAWAALTLAMVLTRGGTLGLLMDLVTVQRQVFDTFVLVSVVGMLLTLVTMIAWFWWFDRVLRNVPPLTGQWPDSGRFAAIGWWLVPIVGLVKAPRIVGDVYARLAVDGSPGLWLLGLWVVTWIGGTVAPWIAERVLGFLPLPLDLLIGLADLISLLSQVSYIVAGVLAIALVLSMEHAQRVRMVMGGAATPGPSGASGADERLRAALTAAAQANAAAKAATRGVAPASTAPGAVPAAAPAPAGLGLRSTIHPASDAGASDASADEPLLQPIQRPPAPAPAAPTSSSIPGAIAAALFTGLPDAKAGDRTGRSGRPAVPRVAMIAVIVAVIAGIIGGVMLAGPQQNRPKTVGDVIDRAIIEGLATPTPGPTLPHPSFRAPTPAPTPVPTPTPVAWVAAADHLASSTYEADWTGRMTLEASLRIGDREPIVWTLSVARAGDSQWSKRRIAIPGDDPIVMETVVLPRTVWYREPGMEWIRRDRSFGDQPVDPLFGVPDARGLTYLRSFKEGGSLRHEFELDGGNDLLVLEFLHDVTVFGLARTGATVVTDTDGDPVRGEMTWAGSTKGGKAKLTIELTYKDVGGTFTIQSPKDGAPVVD